MTGYHNIQNRVIGPDGRTAGQVRRNHIVDGQNKSLARIQGKTVLDRDGKVLGRLAGKKIVVQDKQVANIMEAKRQFPHDDDMVSVALYVVFAHYGGPRSQNPQFVRLMKLAESNEKVHAQLLKILGLDDAQRRHMMNAYIADLKRKGAPDDFLEAVSCLLDDAVAHEAKTSLES